MERPVNIGSGETPTAFPEWTGGRFSAMRSAPERALCITDPLRKRGARK
jgi:hypothetical protein